MCDITSGIGDLNIAGSGSYSDVGIVGSGLRTTQRAIPAGTRLIARTAYRVNDRMNMRVLSRIVTVRIVSDPVAVTR